MNIPFNSFETFLDWFSKTVLPWLATAIGTGALSTIIYKVAKMVGNTAGLKSIQLQEKAELDELRVKYKNTLDAVKSRDELILMLIKATLNQHQKELLMAAYRALPELEGIKTDEVKIIFKKRKKKKNHNHHNHQQYIENQKPEVNSVVEHQEPTQE